MGPVETERQTNYEGTSVKVSDDFGDVPQELFPVRARERRDRSKGYVQLVGNSYPNPLLA